MIYSQYKNATFGTKTIALYRSCCCKKSELATSSVIIKVKNNWFMCLHVPFIKVSLRNADYVFQYISNHNQLHIMEKIKILMTKRKLPTFDLKCISYTNLNEILARNWIINA